ncbi:MAG: hypothetical protein H7Y15_12220, partial [Pseudonocardia sp.]|nr:hypothetical protein [Pseudonocardia sp.]
MSELASRPAVPASDLAQARPQAVDRDSVPSVGPGAMLTGRYRLRTRVGADLAAGAEFWCAEDTVLRRDVAITVLRLL